MRWAHGQTPYFSEFKLNQKYPPFDESLLDGCERVVLGKERNPTLDKPVFYMGTYFPDSKFYHLLCKYERRKWPYFKVDYEDAEFREILFDDFKVERELNLVYPQKCTLSVAIHYRGNDHADTMPHLYLSLTPQKFYVDQLRLMQKRFPGEKIYAHIFTNEPNADRILNFFKNEMPGIDFGMREDFHADDCILDDFFSFFNFDCLIHPVSNFSMMAGKMHPFKYETYPMRYILVEKKPVITHYHITDREKGICEMRSLEIME